MSHSLKVRSKCCDMSGAERLILIGYLLQGALCREWAVWMPQSIEALCGSCVLIPCTFQIQSSYEPSLNESCKGIWLKGEPRTSNAVFDSRSTGLENTIKGNITGDLLQKDCTTILENIPQDWSDSFFFRLRCPDKLKYNFPVGVHIHVSDSAPKPQITPDMLTVKEGTSVSLTCSAPAPCPTLPPALTWTPRLSDSVSQLQENKDKTKSVISVINFTASHLHHGESITCTAVYKQRDNTERTARKKTILYINYSPKNTTVSVSPPGSVLEGRAVTLTCSSNANPAVENYTWYKVEGSEMNTVGSGQNLTFNVTEPRHSGQYYCEALNEHGIENSTTVKLDITSPPQISPSSSCNRTAAEISCSCESRGNPSPSIEWRLSGLLVTNSTDRVIREEQLGSTGLRSSLTVRHSQGDTPTLLCLSKNTLGFFAMQLLVPYHESQYALIGSLASSLLIGAAAGAAGMMLLCILMQLILKNRRTSSSQNSGQGDATALIVTEWSPSQEEESLYANKAMPSVTEGGIVNGEGGKETSDLHYSTIDFSKFQTKGVEQRTGLIRSTLPTTDYAEIFHKSQNKPEGTEDEDAKQEEPGEEEFTDMSGEESTEAQQGQTEPNEKQEIMVERNKLQICRRQGPPEPMEEAIYGNLCHPQSATRTKPGQSELDRSSKMEEPVKMKPQGLGREVTKGQGD